MKLLKDRRGIHTALIVALLLIVGLAVAAVVGHFAMMAGVSSARKAAFEVVGQPLMSVKAFLNETSNTRGAQLVVTVNNIGRSDATLQYVIIKGHKYVEGQRVADLDGDGWQEQVVKINTLNILRQARTTLYIQNFDHDADGDGVLDNLGLTWGDQCEVQIVTDQGTFSFVAFVTE